MWMVSVPWHFLSDTMREVEEEEGPISSWIFSTCCAWSRHPESTSEMAVSISGSRSRYLGLFLELYFKLRGKSSNIRGEREKGGKKKEKEGMKLEGKTQVMLK